MKRIVKKIAIALLSVLLFVLLSIPLFLYLFSDRVEAFAKESINNTLLGEFDYSGSKMTLLSTFPYLSLKVFDFALYDTPSFVGDTVIQGEELVVGVNPFALLYGHYSIERVTLKAPKVKLRLSSEGESNFNFIKPSQKEESEGGGSFGPVTIESLKIVEGLLSFYDEQSHLKVAMDGLDYSGSGKFKKGVLKLTSKVNSKGVTVGYGGVNYIEKKPVKGRFVTEVDTDQLLLKLVRNRLSVGGMRSLFVGELSLGKESYSMELLFKSKNSSLEDLLSLLPPQYEEWYNSTKIKGKANLSLELTGSSGNEEGFEPDLDFHLEVKGGSLRHNSSPITLEQLNSKLEVAVPKLDFDKVEVVLNNLSFITSDGGFYTNLGGKLKGLSPPSIEVEGSGSGDLSKIGESLGIEKYRVEGLLSFKVKGEGVVDLESGALPKGEFELFMSDGLLETPFVREPLQQIEIDLKGVSSEGDMQTLQLELERLQFNFAGAPFKGEATLSNFDSLNYQIRADGKLYLDSLAKLFAIENATVGGQISANFDIANQIGSGQLQLQQFFFKSDGWNYPFLIENSLLNFNEERAELRGTVVEYGDSRVELTGSLSNFVDYFLVNGTMEGRLSVNSKKLDLGQFQQLMDAPAAFVIDSTIVTGLTGAVDTDSVATAAVDVTSLAGNSKVTSVIQLPERVNFVMSSSIERLLYNEMEAKNFRGEVELSDQILAVRDVGVELAGAKFGLDALYKPVGLESAEVEVRAKADSFDIKRAYREVPLFKELFATAANMEGLVSIDYEVKSLLNGEMKPLLPSVVGGGTIKLEEVKVLGLKVLGAVSQATGRDSLNNPSLKGVTIKSSIANNIVSIERTRMRVFGFRPRFEGESSLDGRLNIRFRLGLPPLGIFGIPINITGTLDNPIVKLRRGKRGQILYDREGKDGELLEEEISEEMLEEFQELEEELHESEQEKFQEETEESVEKEL